MRPQIITLFLTLCIIAFVQCRKSKGPSKKLPPITAEGKNTFGCKINGEVWTAYYPCGPGRIACGEIFSDVYSLDPSKKLPIGFEISAAQEIDGFSFFSIRTKQIAGQQVPVNSTGNKIDDVEISFSPSGGARYRMLYTDASRNRFDITKLDTVNKIIAGTFEAVLHYTPTDSVKITEGRFDLQFKACTCSQ
jgi:hypothetical protein